MKRIIVLFAICACLLSCIALSSCDSSSDCKHPDDKVSYSYYMSEEGIGHNAFCNECHKDLGWERCDTPDGKCGKCPTCGYESEHQYVSTGEKNDEGHQVNCFRCKDTTYMPHELSVLDYLSYVRPNEHDITSHCYTCGFETKVIGSHISASNEWKTSEVNHWKLCDVCKGEFEYELHNLVNGACADCGYSADELPVTENLKFELSEDETYYIVTGMQTETLEYNSYFSVVIPATYNDKPVKEIGARAFHNYFSSGYNILTVYIPDGVVKIGSEAFYYNVNIVDVRLPSTLEKIENSAFLDCGIVNLTIPAKTVVANTAFENNGYLKTLVIEEGVEFIGEFAFSNCHSIESIILPSTLEGLAESAFAGCNSIKTLKVDERNKKLVSVDNCLISIADKKLLRSDVNMTVPSQVKILGKHALSCDNNYYVVSKDRLVKRDVVLPLGIELIEVGALSHLTIKEVSFQNASGNNGVYVTGGSYLYDKATGILLWGNENCVIPNDVKELGEKAFSYCEFGDFTVPANIKKVAYNAFFNCTFNSVTIEEGVEEIVFVGCKTNQKTLTIPSTIKTLDNCGYSSYSFGLTGVEKVILSEGVEGLEIYFECEVVLPSTLKFVGNCVTYTTANVTVYEGCRYFGDASNPYYVLLGAAVKHQEIDVKVHKDTKIIANNAFSGDDVLSLTFEDGSCLEYICDGAFFYAFIRYEGGTIVLPDSLKHIGERAFYDERATEAFKIVLGNGIEYVGYDALAARGLQKNSMTWVGAVGYWSTSDNAHMVVAGFDPFMIDGYNGWGEIEYIIDSETKIISTYPGHWNTIIYEGTKEEFLSLSIVEQFASQLNEMVERCVICTDGTIYTIE